MTIDEWGSVGIIRHSSLVIPSPCPVVVNQVAMGRPSAAVEGYRFGDVYVDALNRQLWRNDQLVPLNAKYFDALLFLLSRRGQLVGKQRVFDAVWQEAFVTDAALTQCIKDIRRQIGDDAAHPRYIKTIPKHGYMFVADVVEVLRGEVSAFLPGTGPKPRRPYKFLDYYTEQDAPFFFGREQEVESISSRNPRASVFHPARALRSRKKLAPARRYHPKAEDRRTRGSDRPQLYRSAGADADILKAKL